MASKPTKKPAKAKKAVKAKSKGGRPSLKTAKNLQIIGERQAEGIALAVICRDLKLCDRTVRLWMETDPEVSAAIARAREDGETAIAVRLRKVANGEKAKEGEALLSSGDVQRDKLIIDTDLKLLAKFNPKRWGDKVQLAGHDGGALPAPPAWVIAPVAPRDE